MKTKTWARIAALVVGAVAASGAAHAQTACKYITTNAVLTASQWNYCFQQKTDNLGFTPLNAAGGVMTGKLITAPSTTSLAGLGVPPGVAPLAPKDGDIWTTTSGLFAQINGATVGPIGAGIPASASANLVFAGPASGASAAPTFRSIAPADLPIATAAALGAVQPDGTTITVTSGNISARTATSSLLGIVKPDGATTSVSGAGAITATTATSSALGVVKPDNSTINISTGTLSAATATSASKGVVQPDNSTITISSGTITAHLLGTWNVQTFTATGTFTTPVNSTTSTVYHYRIQGAGGGGGGSNASSATAGGGGSGGYAEGTFTGVSPSTAVSVTVGAFGAGGSNTGGNGGAGGSSSLGVPVSITCAGGGAGGGTVSATGGGGGGGTITGTPNILAIVGQRGQSGVQTNNGTAAVNIISGGYGGNSMFGFGGLGGQAVIGGSPQSAASGYGAGGAGSLSTSAAGSNGSAGIVIIDYIL